MSYDLHRFGPVYVAGHRGLAGRAVTDLLSAKSHSVIVRSSCELDLRNRDDVFKFFGDHRPFAVVDAAARVGGILANSTYPAMFLSDNLQIQLNLMDAALQTGVNRFLFLGSSCIYPRLAVQPIREESLMTGLLEPTNDAYAVAKIAGITHVQAVRRQHGLPWISAMPTNLYGPGDNFDPEKSHVLPALIRRFHEAVQEDRREVVLWGTGTPLREFLHVDDLADALLVVLEKYDDPAPINIGVGYDVTIRELAEIVAETVGFTGDIVQDTTKPDGTPRKLLDSSKLAALGWAPKIGLREGIASTYRWFVDNHDTARLTA